MAIGNQPATFPIIFSNAGKPSAHADLSLSINSNDLPRPPPLEAAHSAKGDTMKKEQAADSSALPESMEMQGSTPTPNMVPKGGNDALSAPGGDSGDGDSSH
jgi:hypothetical protein